MVRSEGKESQRGDDQAMVEGKAKAKTRQASEAVGRAQGTKETELGPVSDLGDTCSVTAPAYGRPAFA